MRPKSDFPEWRCLEESGIAIGSSARTKKTAISWARPQSEYKFKMRISAPLVASAHGCGGSSRLSPKTRSCYATLATVLIDCALRPEESFRLRWEYVRDGAL